MTTTTQVLHRDNYLTREQMIQGLRVEFDARVSNAFCITPEECAELLDRYTAQDILESMNQTRSFLGSEERKYKRTYMEEEIVQFMREFLEDSTNASRPVRKQDYSSKFQQRRAAEIKAHQR